MVHNPMAGRTAWPSARRKPAPRSSPPTSLFSYPSECPLNSAHVPVCAPEGFKDFVLGFADLHDLIGKYLTPSNIQLFVLKAPADERARQLERNVLRYAVPLKAEPVSAMAAAMRPFLFINADVVSFLMKTTFRGVFLTGDDPAATARFYREVAGLDLEKIGSESEYVYWKIDSNGMQLAIHDAKKFADYTHPARVESNVTHLYFKIESQAVFLQHLERLGITPLRTDAVVVTVVDPDGRQVMFGTA